jgi:hypothetical protein
MDDSELTTEELLRMWDEGEPVELERPNSPRSAAAWRLRGSSDAHPSRVYVQVNIEKQGVAERWGAVSGQTEAAAPTAVQTTNRMVAV